MSHLPKFVETLDIIEDAIAKMRINTKEVSTKVAATLFAVALDHAHGIKFCLSNSAYPSAFALLRVLFETYIRAMWIAKCANEEQLKKYLDEDKLVSKTNGKLMFGDMVLEVETAHELPEYFSKIKDHVWSGLNSFTHSGALQLQSNFSGSSIRHRYEKEQINEAIAFSTMIACMSFAALCDLATNTNGEVESEKLMNSVKSWVFGN